jgi:hypothetical protein
MIPLMLLEDERGVEQEVIRTIIIKTMGTSFFYNGSPEMRSGRVKFLWDGYKNPVLPLQEIR